MRSRFLLLFRLPSPPKTYVSLSECTPAALSVRYMTQLLSDAASSSARRASNS